MKWGPEPVLVFAPMATLSHAAFRHLVEDWGGCALYFSEMIDAGQHLAGRRFEEAYADARPSPEKLIFQIVGADEDSLVAAARSLAARDCAGVDLNMGCSAPHIFRQGAGIAWMRDLEKVRRLADRLRRAVGRKTLSMKLRLGEVENEEFLGVARALEGAGADFLTLHPRVRKDSLSRPSRWSWISTLREAVRIPVIGNGDLDSFSALQQKHRLYPADGYMIGRRAAAAPWTFRYWSDRWVDPAADLLINLPSVCHRFHEYLERFQPPEFWVSRSRRFYAYFAQNLEFGHRWGARLQGIRDYSALKEAALADWSSHSAGVVSLASKLE